jgi:L-threonylcarbamoyladenylate synthase
MTSNDDLAAALAALHEGRVVAAATESFFGLLADVTRFDALDLVFSLKKRGPDKAVPLLLPQRASWLEVSPDIPDVALRLAEQAWPGPLTIALPAGPGVDPRLTLNGTVAVRMPGPSAARALVERLGRPVTASSANLPGEPPAANSDEVNRIFAEAVQSGALFVLPGVAPGGKPSTLVRILGDQVTIVREGAIAESEIRAMEYAHRSPP